MKTLVWRLCLDSMALIQTDKLKSNQIWKHVTEMFWPSLTINNAGQFSRFWRNSTTCHSDLWLSLGSLIPPWLGVKIIQERIGSHLLGKQLFVLPHLFIIVAILLQLSWALIKNRNNRCRRGGEKCSEKIGAKWIKLYRINPGTIENRFWNKWCSEDMDQENEIVFLQFPIWNLL